MSVSKYFLVSLIHNNSIQTQISKFRNMPFQRCIKCITSTSVEDIDKLEIRCSDRCGSHTRYISVRDHFKSPVLHSREDPLKVAFIDPTFKSILVTINSDSKLHAILLSIQCKCIQNSPDPSKTQPFLKSNSDGEVQIHLKTQFTDWKDENGTIVTTMEALADHRIVLSTWIIEMYRLFRQHDGTWHVVWALSKGRVVPAKPDETETTTTELDEIEW